MNNLNKNYKLISKHQSGTNKNGIQKQDNSILDKVKMRLYKNLNPSGYYTPIKRVWNAIVKNQPEQFYDQGIEKTRNPNQNPNKEELKKLQAHNPFGDYFMDKDLENDLRNALWAKYLGLTDEQAGFKISDYIEESPYKPPHAKEGEKYYRFNPNLVQILHGDNVVEITPNEIQKSNPYKQEGIISLFQPDSISEKIYPKNIFGGDQTVMKTKDIPVGYKGLDKGWGLGYYTVGTGEDDQGVYSSYYDEWNLNPYKGESAKKHIPFLSNIEDISIIGNPIKLYDRKYRENE